MGKSPASVRRLVVVFGVCGGGVYGSIGKRGFARMTVREGGVRELARSNGYEEKWIIEMVE